MKQLYKSDTNKVIAGVIGGIGEYFEIDSAVLRLAYILKNKMSTILTAVSIVDMY